MKRLLALLLITLAVLCLFACDRGGNTDENNYPDGAIALTKDNLTEYFDIRVTSECYYDSQLGATRASAYVALVPRGEYSAVAGEIRFDLDSRIKKMGVGTGSWRISKKTERLMLNVGLINGEYKTTVSGGDGYGSGAYQPDKSCDRITVTEIKGYVILGKKAPERHEQITNSDRMESPEILAELRERVEGFRNMFDTADSYKLLGQTTYELGSCYGAGKSASGRITHSGIAVDLVNERFAIDNRIFYDLNGITCEQSKNSAGLVVSSRTGMTLDGVLEASTPSWDIFDTGAVYYRYGDNSYYAYTTLYAMQDGLLKDRLISALADYGITTRYDKMTVEYYYGFDGSSFLVGATVDYTDYQYHVHYVDIHAEALQKISDVNNTTVELYDSAKYSFALADTLEDAMLFGAGAVELEKGARSFFYTTYSDSYEGHTGTTVNNYFPLIIKESGVYSFTPSEKSISMYDSEGRGIYPHNKRYYEAGTYYIAAHSVLYGKRDLMMSVSAVYYEDFGSVDAPTPIVDNAYEFTMEGRGDRVVFSYTPSVSGIYSLGDYENVTLSVYLAADLENELCELATTDHCARLEAGVEYILMLEYNADADAPVDHTAEVVFVGTPSDYDGFVLTNEWQDVFLWWEDVERLRADIASVGEYYVEFEWQAGQKLSDGGSFYNLDGSWYGHYHYIDIEDSDEQLKITSLAEGSYDYHVSLYNNRYFIGRVRLVTYTAGVTEEGRAEITSDGYITLTTPNLTTMFSTYTLTFEVTEESKLLYTTDSDFFNIYDKDGRRVSTTYYPTYIDKEFDNTEVRYSELLAPGTYTIVFEIDEYATPGVKEATLRLLPIES